MNPSTLVSYALRERLNGDSAALRAATRRVWLQGRPVYEQLDGRLYAWWPDGRLVRGDTDEPAGYVSPRLLAVGG